MKPTQVVSAFIDAINRHDVPAITALMSDDHVFIDTYGNVETGAAMQTGWQGYFSWFPDYYIEVTDQISHGNIIGVFGYASGTYARKPGISGHWRLPAAWKAVVHAEKVQVWQVFADSKIPYEIMNSADE